MDVDDYEFEKAILETFDSIFEGETPYDEETIVEHEDSDFVEDFLAHYGVKGMKWGVRKAPVTKKVKVTEIPGRRLKTSGGTGQRASDDARKHAINRRKVHASSLDSLSDKQLKALVNRMQMEKQFRELAPTRKQKVMKMLLGKEGRTAVQTIPKVNKLRKAMQASKAASGS